MAWKKVCRADQIADGAALQIEGENPLAVFRVGEEFFATDDTCTHAKFSLAEGYIEGDEVVCALHEARFACAPAGSSHRPLRFRCEPTRYASRAAKFLSSSSRRWQEWDGWKEKLRW